MRSFKGLIFVIVLAGTFASAVSAQEPTAISGPILGFVPENAGKTIRPIFGVPGASVLGSALPLSVDIHDAAISPKHDYGLALRTEDEAVVVVQLSSDPVAVTALDGAQTGPDLIALSPTGSSAAVYDHDSKALQVFGRLPATPSRLFEFDASILPGRVRSLAVSDDGALALLGMVNEESAVLWLVDSTGSFRSVSSAQAASTVFIANRQDVVVLDDQTHEVFVLLEVDKAATRIPLISAGGGIDDVSGIAASADGLRVFAVSEKSGTVAVIDVTGSTTLLSCECRPAGIYSLKGNAVFRLSDSSSAEPSTLIDGSADEVRFLVIPPAESPAALPEGRRQPR